MKEKKQFNQNKSIRLLNIFVLAFLFFYFISLIKANGTEINPATFEYIHKKSLNILELYKHYEAMIQKFNPKFLCDVSMITPGIFAEDIIFVIPTTVGSCNINVEQMDFGFYYRWGMKYFSMALFFLNQGVRLIVPEYELPSYYKNIYDWSEVNDLMGLRFIISKNIIFNFFILGGWSPYIVTAPDGSKQFGVYKEDGKYYSNVYKESKSLVDFYLYGYENKALYNSTEKKLDVYKGAKYIGKKLTVSYNYYRNENTHQAGLGFGDLTLNESISVNSAIFFNIYKKDDWFSLDYVLSKLRINFLRPKHKYIEKFGKEISFYVGSNIGVSYSKGLFDEGLIGYSGDIAFGVSTCALTISFSKNYHEMLYRLPLKNYALRCINIRLGF
ncbi:MAG: hypothetical protein AB1349_03945 [Elusimicrobiota bacterium]